MTAAERKHQIFIEEYTRNGADPVAAYRKAYPKASVESARVKSYSLLKNVTIQKEIVTRQKDLADQVQQAAIAEVKEEFKGNVLSLARKRELLRQIAEGELRIPTSKPYWDKAQGKFVMIPIDELPSPQARTQAIELDARIAGEIAPTKLFAAVAGVNEEGDLQNKKRFVVLSNGQRIQL